MDITLEIIDRGRSSCPAVTITTRGSDEVWGATWWILRRLRAELPSLIGQGPLHARPCRDGVWKVEPATGEDGCELLGRHLHPDQVIESHALLAQMLDLPHKHPAVGLVWLHAPRAAHQGQVLQQVCSALEIAGYPREDYDSTTGEAGLELIAVRVQELAQRYNATQRERSAAQLAEALCNAIEAMIPEDESGSLATELRSLLAEVVAAAEWLAEVQDRAAQ